MKFKTVPERVSGHWTGRKTTGFYVFGADKIDPDRDIYEQGFVIERQIVGKQRNGEFHTEFYVRDGQREFAFRKFGQALKKAKEVMRGLGHEVTDDTEQELAMEYNLWLASEKLPKLSMDELRNEDLKPHQERVLWQFLLRWNTMEKACA
jgi:hypothetical protein